MNEDQSSPEKSNPKGKQHFRNVQWRIMVRQLPLLLVLYICLLFWLEGHLEDALHSTNIDIVRQSVLIRTTRIGLIITGVLACLLTFVSTRFVLGRYLNRPLQRLVTGARALGSGDLELDIRLPKQTELSILAETFNQSAKQLREGIQKITDQRDDLQTLYFIADQLSQTIKPEERRRRAVEIVGSIFKSDCLIITGHTHPETREFHGMLTYRDSGPEIRELPIGENQADPEISFFSPGLFKQWLRGELDGRIRDAGIVAYPLERRGRRLGLTMAPARRRSETPDGRSTAASPKVVRAFLKHLAIALELSELQREYGRQERLAAVGETVAGLSHCIKNTLNGLRGGLYVVERAMETDNEERLEQGWKVLTNSVREIERLSLDMLYFVGERKPQLKPVNPNKILNEIVNLLAEQTSHHGVSLKADLDEGIGQVMLDRLAVYRAVLNLVTNAVDACYESENGDLVTVRSRATAEELVLSIQDNGVGMSEFTRQRVFERYFSTKAARGTGLGLPVVKKIMDEMGGHVVVESTLGQGSTFHLHLPRKTAEE
jgi:signal transduction histidine kinase/HAMP domain-containing protein